VKLGTRGSRLALWQAEWVRSRLEARGTTIEVVVIKTRGDAEIDRPLHMLEGKGFFTKEIEDALLDGRIDAAVHSLKDLPTRFPEGLALAAIPERADPVDVLVARGGGGGGGGATVATSLAALAPGARLGTSSLRRVAQAKHVRPDLEVVPLRGNVPTRVAKVKEGKGGLDAAMLAAAGLERLGLSGDIAARLDPLEIMPAPGQGALGLEIRADDRAAREVLAALAHEPTTRAVTAERALLAALEGGCQAPVAAFVGQPATGNAVVLYGRVTAPDGSVQLTASAPLDGANPVSVGEEVARLLIAQGAEKFLAR
jgi:hydroxymethylbilane synthase